MWLTDESKNVSGWGEPNGVHPTTGWATVFATECIEGKLFSPNGWLRSSIGENHGISWRRSDEKHESLGGY